LLVRRRHSPPWFGAVVPLLALLLGPGVLFAIFFAKNDNFLGSVKYNEKWYCFGEARHPLCSLKIITKFREILRKFAKFCEK
jgi:hypothetical protein